MGLKGYRAYKRRMEIVSFLASYGITERDLQFLHEAVAIVREMRDRPREEPKPAERAKPDDKEMKEMKERQDRALKPDDVVAMFAGDAEEFRPNGIGRGS